MLTTMDRKNIEIRNSDDLTFEKLVGTMTPDEVMSVLSEWQENWYHPWRRVFAVSRTFRWFPNPFKKIKYIFRDIKYFFHRGLWGWADNDTWDIHSYLLFTLPLMFKSMRRTAPGFPSEICMDGEKHVLYEDKKFNMDKMDETWKNCLDGIVRQLELADDNYYQAVLNKTIFDNPLVKNDSPGVIKVLDEVDQLKKTALHKALADIEANFYNLWT